MALPTAWSRGTEADLANESAVRSQSVLDIPLANEPRLPPSLTRSSCDIVGSGYSKH